MNRTLEADASAYSSAVAYELYQSTSNEAFLTASSLYGEQDIMGAFVAKRDACTEIDRDIDAFGASFDAWYCNPKRVDGYDRDIIQLIEEQEQSLLFSMFNIGSGCEDLGARFLDIGSLAARVNYLRDTGRDARHIAPAITAK